MPSVSDAQRRFFRIAYHSKKFREKHGISEAVAAEWYHADQAKERARQAKRSSKPEKPAQESP